MATILDGSGYTHSDSTNKAYAEVQDAENTSTPELTVSAEITKVYQEESIVFTISRTGSTTDTQNFKYDLTEVEDVIDDQYVIENEGKGIDGRIDANATQYADYNFDQSG